MRGAIAIVLAAFTAAATVSCASASDRGPSGPSATERREVAAPIDSVDVRILESSPPQYMLHVKAGLPSGCAEKNRHDVQRAGETISVSVLNWVPAGDPPCTAIYGSYELNINLGSDFRRGTTYTVTVN
ncbi:MAG TPA: hypothetical protein VEA16_01790, partial [Vicinamibacterales bacterium]|nr:hypothetical protein [Vicinamibacterales bacterium]